MKKWLVLILLVFVFGCSSADEDPTDNGRDTTPGETEQDNGSDTNDDTDLNDDNDQLPNGDNDTIPTVAEAFTQVDHNTFRGHRITEYEGNHSIEDTHAIFMLT